MVVDTVSSDRIDRLGSYFVYFNLLERFDMTFEEFVITVDSGNWDICLPLLKQLEKLDVRALCESA